jgi:hypothetical protein
MFSYTLAFRRTAVSLSRGTARAKVPLLAAPFNSISKRSFILTPGQPDPADDDSQKGQSQSNWKDSTMKVLETAGATLASIAVLGLLVPPYTSCHAQN